MSKRTKLILLGFLFVLMVTSVANVHAANAWWGNLSALLVWRGGW